jgi:hypothetical protein
MYNGHLLFVSKKQPYLSRKSFCLPDLWLIFDQLIRGIPLLSFFKNLKNANQKTYNSQANL